MILKRADVPAVIFLVDDLHESNDWEKYIGYLIVFVKNGKHV